MLNSAQITGNLVEDPKRRDTRSGTSMCVFTIANNEFRKRGNDFEKHTHYLDCVAFGATADRCLGLSRGDQVTLEASLRMDEWTDKYDQRRRSIELKVQRVHIVKRANEGTPGAGNHGRRELDPTDSYDEDDIPF
jgi:single-strand DNA-binding protein